MRLKSRNSSEEVVEHTIDIGSRIKQEDWAPSTSPEVKGEPGSRSQSPTKRSQSPASRDGTSDEDDNDDKQVIGGEVMLKHEPGRRLKLERKASQKIENEPPALFDHYEDATDEAKSTFEVIDSCTYSAKYLGASGEASMDCDCAEEWGKQNS